MKSSSQKMCPRYASSCRPRAGTLTSSSVVCFDTVVSRKMCRLSTRGVSDITCEGHAAEGVGPRRGVVPEDVPAACLSVQAPGRHPDIEFCGVLRHRGE